jgi:hypothetical protein
MYSTRPTHLILLFFVCPNNIWRGVKILKLLIMHFSPPSCYSVPLWPKYSPQLPVVKHTLFSSLVRFPLLSWSQIRGPVQYLIIFRIFTADPPPPRPAEGPFLVGSSLLLNRYIRSDSQVQIAPFQSCLYMENLGGGDISSLLDEGEDSILFVEKGFAV